MYSKDSSIYEKKYCDKVIVNLYILPLSQVFDNHVWLIIT